MQARPPAARATGRMVVCEQQADCLLHMNDVRRVARAVVSLTSVRSSTRLARKTCTGHTLAVVKMLRRRRCSTGIAGDWYYLSACT